jgi:hypothetical protein
MGKMVQQNQGKGTNMKKLMMIVIMGLVAVSYGEVKIDWKGSSGFYSDVNPFGILGDATGNSTYVQLMYSADNVQDAGGVKGIGINRQGYDGGDDIYWSSLLITENGVAGDFDEYAAFSSFEERAFTSGYVYAMIFQDSNVQVDDWYYYTGMVAVEDITGATPNQGIEMNTDLLDGNAIDSSGLGVNTAQVVPEPATFLLVAMGGLVSFLVRRLRTA